MKSTNTSESIAGFTETMDLPVKIRFKPNHALHFDAPRQAPQSKSAKIAVPVLDGLQMLNTEEIVKCISLDNYTEIILTNGSKYKVSRVLKDYEQLLTDFNFFRIHNSCLINLRHVKKYIKGDGGFVMLTDGVCCEVSRRKKARLIQRLAMIPL